LKALRCYCVLEGHQDGFPVVQIARTGGIGVLVGYLTWKNLGEMIRRLGPDALVGHAMQPACVLPDEPVENVMKLWDGTPFEPKIPVLVRDDEGKLLGIVTEADVENLTVFTAALRAREEAGLPNLLYNDAIRFAEMQTRLLRRAA
jgi:CBS domain-containing protein